jgi:hypothetical protein
VTGSYPASWMIAGSADAGHRGCRRAQNTRRASRGVGEVPLVPVMVAVANAVHDALGMRHYTLLMAPPNDAGQ